MEQTLAPVECDVAVLLVRRGFPRELRDALRVQLKQDVAAQLALLTRRMAAAGINIEVHYSDHTHRLMLVVDDMTRARQVAEAWTRDMG